MSLLFSKRAPARKSAIKCGASTGRQRDWVASNQLECHAMAIPAARHRDFRIAGCRKKKGRPANPRWELAGLVKAVGR